MAERERYSCCARQNSEGVWCLEGCYCQNYDDAQAAGAFVGRMNARREAFQQAAEIVRTCAELDVFTRDILIRTIEAAADA